MPHSGTAGGGPRYPKTTRFGMFWITGRLVAALFDPQTNLIFHGKPLRGGTHKL
jgi:hypothetical protein